MPDRDISLTHEKPSEQDVQGDWYRVNGLPGDIGAHVLAERDTDGRVVIREVRISGRRVLAETMYEMPLGQIARLLNFAEPTVTVDGVQVAAPYPLRRVRGQDAVGFAHQVAVNYRWYAAQTNAPAKAIAEASGVPVGTVHGWIREARKLGQLPPGRRGSVG